MATAEGTGRFLRRAIERGALHATNARKVESLSCAAIGFGAYRIGGGAAEAQHTAALQAAIRNGVNLIDTSSHYRDPAGGPGSVHGASERLIGKVLAELLAAREVERDELIVCTKLGHVEQTPEAESVPGAVPIAGKDGSSGQAFHCIEPAFVDAEVRRSRDRLGTPPDFVLLHNPEYFLSEQLRRRAPIGDAWGEMYHKLEEAFKVLEGLCDEGVIAGGYGVSGNFLSCLHSTTGRPNLYEALALDRVLDAAKVAGGSGHRFRLAQLPLNAVESGAVLGRGRAVPEAADGDCGLAGKLGVPLVANRPLMALPLPGVGAGDWGRSGPEHLRLREAKPMGTLESLLRRVLLEALPEEGPPPPLQQLSLRLAASAPSVSCCLLGMRAEAHVEDAAAVLKTAALPPEQVARAMATVRQAAEELGVEKRGLW